MGGAGSASEQQAAGWGEWRRAGGGAGGAGGVYHPPTAPRSPLSLAQDPEGLFRTGPQSGIIDRRMVTKRMETDSAYREQASGCVPGGALGGGWGGAGR